jgi:hypothetical protein
MLSERDECSVVSSLPQLPLVHVSLSNAEERQVTHVFFEGLVDG